jgi:hypothetical protein
VREESESSGGLAPGRRFGEAEAFARYLEAEAEAFLSADFREGVAARARILYDIKVP